jgi:hypothetical protein
MKSAFSYWFGDGPSLMKAILLATAVELSMASDSLC